MPVTYFMPKDGPNLGHDIPARSIVSEHTYTLRTLIENESNHNSSRQFKNKIDETIKQVLSQRTIFFINQIGANKEGPVSPAWLDKQFSSFYVRNDGLDNKNYYYCSFLADTFLKQLFLDAEFMMNEDLFLFQKDQSEGQESDNIHQANAVIDSAFKLFDLCDVHASENAKNSYLLLTLVNIYYRFKTVCERNPGKVEKQSIEHFQKQFEDRCKEIGCNNSKDMLEKVDSAAASTLDKIKDVLFNKDYCNAANKNVHAVYRDLVATFESIPDDLPRRKFIKIGLLSRVIIDSDPNNSMKRFSNTVSSMFSWPGLSDGHVVTGLSNKVLDQCVPLVTEYLSAVTDIYKGNSNKLNSHHIC